MASLQGAGPGPPDPWLGLTTGHWVLTWKCTDVIATHVFPHSQRRLTHTQLVWLGVRVHFGQQVPNQFLRSPAPLLCSSATCLGSSPLDFSFSGDDLYIPSHLSEVLRCSSSAPGRCWVLAGDHHPWWPQEGATREMVSDGDHQAGWARGIPRILPGCDLGAHWLFNTRIAACGPSFVVTWKN